MNMIDLCWWWLVHAAVLSTLVLAVGALALLMMTHPADRLRVIEWVFAGCLIAPWLTGFAGWKTVNFSLIGPLAESSSTEQIDIVRHFPSAPPAPTVAHPEESLVTRRPTADNAARLAAAEDAGRSSASSTSSPAANRGAPPTTSAAPSSSRSVASLAGNWRAAVVFGYFAVVLAMAGRWAAGLWRRRCLQRRATAASPQLQSLCRQLANRPIRRLRLLVSEEIEVPLTWGITRPVIVMPARMAQSPHEARVRWCLAHELLHVDRCDVASLLLANLVQILYFYQPLCWLLRRQMILCQDYIADARAGEEMGSREDYAEFLVQLARVRLLPKVSGALGIIEHKSRLFHRVKMLLTSGAPIRSRCQRAVSVLIATSSLCFLAMLSTIELDAAENTPGKPVPDTASAATPPPQMEAEVGVVQGIVLRGSDAQPVASARVILRTGTASYTETDREGRFRFERLPAYQRGYQVWAHHKNLASNITPVRQLETADGDGPRFESLRLVMEEGKKASFLVTSEVSGKPIAGAVVRFGFPDRRRMNTGVDGTATVQGLLPQSYDVTVEAEGHARATPQIDLSHGEKSAHYNVPLAAGGVVRGVVLTASGDTVPAADVVYREGSGVGYYGDQVRTDEQGRFQHRFLPLNKAIEVSVRKTGFIAQQQDVVLTDARRELEIKATLAAQPRSGPIAGVVLDPEGAPVSGARVANYGRSSSPHAAVETDNQGRFLLADLMEGSGGYAIAVSAKSFAPQLVTVQPGTSEQPGEVKVALKPGHAISGRIVEESGAPVPQALVSVRSAEYPLQLGETIRTDDEGAFAFDSLPADAHFDVSTSSHAALRSTPLELDSEESVTVTLESPGIIRGKVVDAASGQPLPQFRVRVGFSSVKMPDDAKGSYDATWSNPGLTYESADGRFVVKPLNVGFPAELTIEADGYERSVVPRAVATQADRAEELAISVKRTDRSRFAALRGQLLDHAGKPAAGAQLRLIVSSTQPTGPDDNKYNWALIDSGQLGQRAYCEQYLFSVTDDDGRFAFTEILPGKYLQLAYWGSGVPKSRSLAFDETRPGEAQESTIELPKPATVRGTFDRATFADAGSVRLSREDEAWQTYEIKLSDQQSEFEFNDLPPGSYDITVAAKPERFTEGGNVFFRVSPIAFERFQLKAGENRTFKFTERNAKQ